VDANRTPYSVFEWVSIFVVIIAATSLYFQEEDTSSEEQELKSVYGTIELSTRDSMDSLGLDDFKIGALAYLNLSSKPVLVETCTDCSGKITGISLQGPVIITELFDSENRKGRVEASLNFTHLIEKSDGDYVNREWIIFDWDAGDISESWELVIIHNPPRWLPKYDMTSMFIETDLGLETRSGPELLIKTPEDGIRLIKGCLPDSFLCRSSSPDGTLVANYGTPDIPINVDLPTSWARQNISSIPIGTPDESILDEVIDRGNQTQNDIATCPNNIGNPTTASTYPITNTLGQISPLSSWFLALDMTPITLHNFGNTYVHIEYSEYSCYNLLNLDGEIELGLIIY